MATEKQIAANRRNALRSTGLRARSILIPGENGDDLRQLREELAAEWRPRNRTEHLLVEQMAVAQWKLARLEVGERLYLMGTMGAKRQLNWLRRS